MVLHPAERPAELTDTVPCSAVPADPDAVLARSALAASPSLRLQLGDVAADLIEAHTILHDGTVVLAVDPMTPTGGLLVAARGQPGAVRLDVTQLVPVAVRSRVWARVQVLGTSRRFDPGILDSCDSDTIMLLLDLPAVALWAVEPVEVGLTRDTGGTTVSVSAFRAAQPDPLAADQARDLQHLTQCHGDVLDRLATLVDPALTVGVARVVPVAVDADGIVLRAEAPDRHTDVRLPFAHRLTSHASLAEGLRMLLAQAARRGSACPPRSTASTQRTPVAVCDLPKGACGMSPV
ncbi:DUF2470 domain-containing protein [Micromonospora sp. HUAS LYJ1]|uniref:DUF2470 domain-containing protein n=1 Tax=Micromonospora sp. HUAS LYJ1 TaxID=3061626 RepID=UPI002672CD8F|nr:DUF2470 domain-containing protein [Micromonospora sp. HUAS LYJ1]WKU05598.1 DUF2470 domain-containing protein [Micromonospora sp. HUAS LYJ1]